MRFTALLLAAVCLMVLCRPLPSSGTRENYKDYIVRAGLAYGSAAVRSVPLEIVSGTGTGFRAGYYGSDRTFTELYTIAGETKVTVIRSLHYNISTDTYVDDGSTASNVVGAYHIELDKSFDTQAELDAAVAKVYGATNYVCFPVFTSSGYRVRIGRYVSQSDATADLQTISERLASTYPDASVKVVGKGTNGYTVLRTGTRTVLYEFDGASKQLALLPYGGETETKFGSYKYYGGFDFAKASSTTIQVVSVVNLVQYVKGVTPYELNTSWPEESLKAHACCAATFAICNKNRHSTYGFDVCTGQHCQVYRGTTSLTAKISDCVDAVAGMIITYNGKPIDAVYHSSNGGWTEDSENVWVSVVPYLRSVPDTFETLSEANNGLWTVERTGEWLGTKLRANGYTINEVTSVEITKYTAAGSAYSLTLQDAAGNSVTLSKENMRMVLGTNTLLSQNFRVYSPGKIYLNDGSASVDTALTGVYAVGESGETALLEGTAPSVLTADGVEKLDISGSGGTFVFDGKGWGHSLGLSQIGSRGMSWAGWTFDQIIKYYFTGVTISGFDD